MHPWIPGPGKDVSTVDHGLWCIFAPGTHQQIIHTPCTTANYTHTPCSTVHGIDTAWSRYVALLHHSGLSVNDSDDDVGAGDDDEVIDDDDGDGGIGRGRGSLHWTRTARRSV